MPIPNLPNMTSFLVCKSQQMNFLAFYSDYASGEKKNTILKIYSF